MPSRTIRLGEDNSSDVALTKRALKPGHIEHGQDALDYLLATGYDLGVNGNIRKPVDFNQFTTAIKQLGLYWLMWGRLETCGRLLIGLPGPRSISEPRASASGPPGSLSDPIMATNTHEYTRISPLFSFVFIRVHSWL